MSSKLSRRAFVAGSVAASTLAFPTTKASALGSNERVRLGLIGVGNRGDQVADAFVPHKDCEITAICDVYEPYVDAAKKKFGGGNAAAFKDYRKLLDDKNVDAVMIATPDHWHAKQMIDACRAGKHVYVEKPASLAISEGRRMCDVATETKRVVQVGLNRRSTKHIAEAVERIKAGDIGKVTLGRAFSNRNEFPMGIGNTPDSEPPAGLDWDMWLGPAKKVPFNENRCLYKFRWFWDYSGGQITNLGTHYLDIIQWALGQDMPKTIFTAAGKFAVQDNREIPDTVEALWMYDGVIVSLALHNANSSLGSAKNWEMEFQGTKGTLGITATGYEIIPEMNRTVELPARGPLNRAAHSQQERQSKLAREPVAVKGRSGIVEHTRNFLDCIKFEDLKTNCTMEIGHRATSATILANVSLKLGRSVAWDGKNEKIVNDDEANKLLTVEHRSPWGLG